MTELWWSSQPQGHYWLEITGRDDIGTNLKRPSKEEMEHPPHWSYSLLLEVQPGDLVFHWQRCDEDEVGCCREDRDPSDRLSSVEEHGARPLVFSRVYLQSRLPC